MQLEDFNHAMLRSIYAFHLALFGLFVLFMGFLFIPLGFFAVLAARGRLIHHQC